MKVTVGSNNNTTFQPATDRGSGAAITVSPPAGSTVKVITAGGAGAGLAYDQANVARTTANDAYTQANSARGQANTARDQANSALGKANTSANTVRVYANSSGAISNVFLNFVNTASIQVSVFDNLDGNANIAFSTTGAAVADAYTQANAARDQANTARDNANGSYGQANGAYSQANGAYAQANGAYEQANGAYAQANGAYAQANGAYAQANLSYAQANDAYTQANSARDQANTARTTANDSYGQANTARDQANTARTTANDSYAQANTARDQANTARTIANDAYAQANSAYHTANDAYGQANGAYAQANGAYSQANGAYSQANTAANTVRVYANSAGELSNKFLNFINTASIQVSVTDNADGNANISFVTTGAAVADAYAQANAARDQANIAYGQANDAYAQANTGYAQANAAYAEANLKLNLTGGTINGSLNISGNLTITGNTTYQNVNTYIVDDPLIYLAANNETSDLVDIGFMGGHNTAGIYQHSGLVRDAGDGTWYLFTGLSEEGHENNVVDFANTTLATLRANINANSILLTGNAVATQANLTLAHNQANSARDQANTARNTANDSYGQANAARNHANSAYTQANNARNQANAAYNAANTKLSLTGGTMSGAIDMGNNFISGIRGMYFDEIYGDSAEDQINFYRDGTSWDSLVAWNGVLYFTPGRTGSSGTLNKIWHEGNDGAGSGLDADTVDGIHGSVITTAYSQANAAYSQANDAYAQANVAANTVKIYANSSGELSNKFLNFVNTSTIVVSVSDNLDGNANISFAVTGASASDAYNQANNAYDAANNAANTVRVSQNGSSTLAAKQLNFVNTGSVTVVVSDSGNGNANVEFISSGSQDYSYNTTTTSIETIDSWSANTYRSGKYQLQVSSSIGYLACEIFVIHNGTAVNAIQFANASLGGSVGTFSADLSEGLARLRFTATDITTRIRFYRSLLQNDAGFDPEVLPTDLMTGIDNYDLMNELYLVPSDLNA